MTLMLWALFSFALIVALVISMQPPGRLSSSGNASPQGHLGRRLAMAAAILVPALAVVLYTQLAAPTGPATSPAPSLADGLALPSPEPQAPAQGSLPDVDTMVQRLADRLKTNPGDVKGWKMLGWSYSHLERPADAVDAYRHAIGLAPSDPELHAQYAEALVQAAHGKVTDEAHKAITDTLAINANEPRARYLAGLWQEQQGQDNEAFDAWNRLLESSDITADWIPELKSRLEKLATKLGRDTAPYRTAPSAAALPSFGGAAPVIASPHAAAGPSPDDVAAANAMSPESRTQMINGMVDKLYERLRQNPKDLDGWLMLARSRMVMGDANAARTAIAKAREVFAGDTAAQTRITDHARDIGLAP